MINHTWLIMHEPCIVSYTLVWRMLWRILYSKQYSTWLSNHSVTKNKAIKLWNYLCEKKNKKTQSIKICKTWNSYYTVLSKLWKIHYDFLIIRGLFQETSGDGTNSKIWEISKILVNITRGYCAFISMQKYTSDAM